MACRKVRYATRQVARQARRQISDPGLRPYLCDACHAWHLGHLPAAILRGRIGRGDVYGG